MCIRDSRVRACEVDVPDQGQDSTGAAGKIHSARKNRPAGHGLCAARPERAVAGQTGRQALAMTKPAAAPVARLRDVGLRYGKVCALEAVTLDIPAGCMVGLIGPDGVGKSSLLALIAGARALQSGQIEVLGGDM